MCGRVVPDAIFVALIGLSLSTPQTSAAAPCQGTCARELADCERTCPEQGRARGDCRDACAARTTRTAPGARIRTVAYEVTSSHPRVILVTLPAQATNGRHVNEVFLIDGDRLLQLTNFGRFDTGFGYASIARGRVFFTASANRDGANPDDICQLFSIDKFGGDLRQVTRFRSDAGPGGGCAKGVDIRACIVDVPLTIPIQPDEITGTLLFASSCDPVGGNPFGDQLFAMRADGTGLRQVTSTRGREMLPDGTLRVEMVGPFAYPLGPP